MQALIITVENLSIEAIQEAVVQQKILEIDAKLADKVKTCRIFLEKEIADNQKAIYGINTGFGALCNVKIAKDQRSELQHNLVRSHACGLGNEVNSEIVKLILLLKIRSLAYGYSGVKQSTIDRLIQFYNLGIYPVVYEQGSLGASGDLAPLAHLSLPLFGEGKVRLSDGILIEADELEKKFGLTPLHLSEKEGLALLNGTQFMSAYGLFCINKLQHLMDWSLKISAISCDAFDCRIEPFHPLIHQVRPHKGQSFVAGEMLKLLKESPLAKRKKAHVQDPYSFRCIPQVLGASYDVLWHVKNVFETEINSVTDNPNIFAEEELILSGGNFHGQTLAMALDYLCMASHEVGSISERRVYQLVSGKRELPLFLSTNPGLQSGMMIPQYTAASIVSQNKQLTMPASTDSIESSAGQEDHVSMGANAATKLLRVIENLESILAVELFVAAQAIEFRRPVKSSPLLEKLIKDYRIVVPFVEKDRIFHDDLVKTKLFMKCNPSEF